MILRSHGRIVMMTPISSITILFAMTGNRVLRIGKKQPTEMVILYICECVTNGKVEFNFFLSSGRSHGIVGKLIQTKKKTPKNRDDRYSRRSGYGLHRCTTHTRTHVVSII